MRLMNLAYFTALLLVGCQTPYADNFAGMQTGMSRQDVRELLGDPRAIATAASIKADPNDPYAGMRRWHERWVYGSTGLIGLSSGINDDARRAAPADAWVVYFDEAGTVIDFEEPIPDYARDDRALPDARAPGEEDWRTR